MYLNCKTYYSFCYGTFSAKELVAAAVEHGIASLAITNINSTCDTWEFVKLCRESSIEPIAGVEIRNGDTLLYILLAANNDGLTWIHTFLSEHLMAKKDFPEASSVKSFFYKDTDGFVIYPLRNVSPENLRSNERIGILYTELTKIFAKTKRYADKYVVRQPVTVQNKQYHNLHRLLRCIDKNILLSKLPIKEQCSLDEIFLSPAELLNKFKAYPTIVTNTYKLMEKCTIHMDFGADKTKKTFGETKEDDRILLEKLAQDGIQSRYGKTNKASQERISKERRIIDTMACNSYFLINYDIIRYAQSRKFYYIDRGSGANSIVAYCLRITDVDPLELRLFFERFLNPERTSPPDFDIDFSWTDRDEVIDYIFKRYGKSKVALLGSFPTFKHDSIIWQLGKVLGIPDEEIKELQRTNQSTDKMGRLIVQYGKMMHGFPSHPSLHPCGMIISEEPILSYGILFTPPKGFPTLQMDMFTANI